MLQSMYIALSGLTAQQYNIDVIGNNIANINTAAFKSGRTDFADALYSQMQKPIGSGNYLVQGSGLLVGAVQRISDAGVPIASGNPLDFMLEGQGFFTLQGPQGQAYYTRDGSFKVSMENGSGYLVSAEGYYVLSSNNQRIKIPGDASMIAADSSGNLSLNGTKFAALKITAFQNPSGLLDAGGNKYLPAAAAGAATAGNPVVAQGLLEGSNVDMAMEMTRLMRAQKAYSVMGTAIKTADEMESLANSMSK